MSAQPMELPNYYLADLPDQSTLSPQLVTEACHTIKRNRHRFLLPRTTSQIIQVIAALARDWRDPEFPFRQQVLKEGPARTGFSPETLARRLDAFFARITPENLHALVLQDISHEKRLDEFVTEEPDNNTGGRSSIARGPELLVQVTGGVLPNPSVTSIILGLLARSAQFIKCASGTSLIPRLFAHSLYQVEPKLGSCLEIAEWKGGTEPLEAALFAEATCVTATGNDETLTAIRRRLPASVRFLGYGHRVSFAYVTHEMTARANLPRLMTALADDVVAWNQLGCLSPHVIYIQPGGAADPEHCATLLAEALQARQADEPRGNLPPAEAAAISTRRMFYQVRASHEDTTRLWTSENSTDWTVVYEQDPQFQNSCLNRFVYVKPIAGLDQLLEAVSPVTGKVSTVGLSTPIHRAQDIATRLAAWGVTRVCPVGQMQDPPFTWRHDGRPSLADLVTWTDWEF